MTKITDEMTEQKDELKDEMTKQKDELKDEMTKRKLWMSKKRSELKNELTKQKNELENEKTKKKLEMKRKKDELQNEKTKKKLEMKRKKDELANEKTKKKLEMKRKKDELTKPKKSGFRRLWKLVVMILTGVAVVQELRKPEDQREWHGYLGGVVPYELRPPTPQRMRERLWDPEGALVGPQVFGVGWGLNLGRVYALWKGRSEVERPI
jgi:hypothetical protein